MVRLTRVLLLLLTVLSAAIVVVMLAVAAVDKPAAYLPVISMSDGASLSGQVVNGDGPLAGALVRIQATTNKAIADQNGRFLLSGLLPEEPVRVSAWADGYYIGGGQAHLPGDDIVITLNKLPGTDNHNYEWISAHAAPDLDNACQQCHSDATGKLPYDEWLLDAHSQTTSNGRFLNMYLGTDSQGNQSPPTEYVCTPDYGCFPRPPDASKPYYGPGYKLDFPESAGNCAACHAPAAAVNQPLSVDPTTTAGVGSEGVACDFCHKVSAVKLNSQNGLPFDNMPGVMSYKLMRPPEGHQYFSGPFDDVAPGEDTYSPLQRESRYCAPCHSAVFWDTQVYNSYGEWLDSPYSDPSKGQTCQDCHMPVVGVDHFARIDQGGLRRDPALIASHLMPGAGDIDLLQAAISLDAQAIRFNDQVEVIVTITNDQTGHHVPTGSPLRQILLLVEAKDDAGMPLRQVGGPTIPEWGGLGDPSAGYFAGLPGTGYAKILKELWTGISPTGAYWNQTTTVSDNRLAAFSSDTNLFTFDVTSGGMVTIEVRLLYRRAFIELAAQKSWDLQDIVMEEEGIEIP